MRLGYTWHMKNNKSTINNEPTISDVINLVLKNSATKSDVLRLEGSIKDLEINLRRDLASKKDLVTLKEELTDTMSSNTNKILSALLELNKAQDEKINRNYADLLVKINLLNAS